MIAPLKIGNITLKNNLLLAPLAGVTDAGFRKLARQFGAGLSYTEMVSGKGLMYGSKNTEILLATSSAENPVAVQLFGSEPDVIARAVQNPLLDKFDIIDINMGCPMEKIVKNGEGSAMMKDQAKAYEVIRAAAQSTNRPVTVKFRLGYTEITAPSFAEMCQKAGAAAITIHGRLKSQLYSGRANYQPIKEAVRAVDIPVIVNGDITDSVSFQAALEQTGAAGGMIGRAAMGCPWIFQTILFQPTHESQPATETQPNAESGKTTHQIAEIILAHIAELKKTQPSKLIALNMRKHVAWYLRGARGVREIKERVNKALSVDEVEKIISELLLV